MNKEYEINNNKLLNKINNDLKKALSEKRYSHSVGVMKKAEELAKIYNIDTDKAKLTGLAHDIGKEFSEEEMLKYVTENNIEIDNIEKINVGLLHGKIGADICKKKYGFTQDMQDAIKYHTVGNVNMDLLAKIIYIADKIEDGRKYNDEEKMKTLEKIREIAKKDINLALIFSIDSSMIYTIKKGKLIHIDSVLLRNKLIKDIRNYKKVKKKNH